MSLWKKLFSTTGSAPEARERLQILLSHERQVLGGDDLLSSLREDILAAVAKRVPCDRDAVKVRLERGTPMSVLEIEVEIRGNVELGRAQAA
ncbi:cell division topological specificity factor MinE [Starkeya sp. ORNL1]|jgi:cell division topological specificity factor|uniref:cell division topological specificity factor MinE n=1 Tax=Starkeya sp. ORNL1 TaxID=2709380 RepID=UPI001462F67D|nr:cell division topological specificity factor MinE [Starkeya sp. ORNL1]QJP17138.1 cell division topological specificity factor MinE [Starkeya sp. ORNL1]